MTTAKVEHTDGGYTVTLRSGDWHSEFRRDVDGLAYRIIRSYTGSLVKRLPVSVDTFRDVLETAQQFVSAENAITRTLKKHRDAGVDITFK
jgi:hypothetical protein